MKLIHSFRLFTSQPTHHATTTKKRTAFILALLALLSAPLAQAVDKIKADNTDNLNLDTSWTTSPQPGVDDVAVWDSTVTAANTTLLGGNLSWQGIRIADPTGLVTISAGNTLTLGTAGIDMSAATQNLTLNPSITVGASQLWTVGTGRTLTLGGVVAINNALSLTGPGTFSFSGNNTGTGQVTLNSGTIRLETTTAKLGTGAMVINGGTITSSSGGADWTLTNSSYAFNGDFTMAGVGAGKKHIFNTGAITLGGAGITRTVTVSGSIGQFTAMGDGGNGNGFTKEGTASLVLTGAQTYTGTTTINAGTLFIGGSAGNNSISGTSATGSLDTLSAIVLGGGTLSFGRSTAVVQGTDFSASAITGTGNFEHRGTSTLELNVANTFSGGATTVRGSDLVLKNALAVQNSTLTRTGAGNIIFDSASGTAWTVGGLGGAGNLALLDNAGSPNALALTISGNGSNGNISGAISGTGATITKNGANTQTFSGATANTYSGLTTVNSGQLTLSKTAGQNAIGAGLLITGGTVQQTANDQIGDSAQVELTGGTWNNSAGIRTETIGTLLLNGGTISANSGTNTFTITAGSSADLQSGTVGANVTLNGVTSINKTTAGTLALLGNVAYSGATNISAGTLTIGNATTFSSTSEINLTGTGRLDVNVANQSLTKLNTGTTGAVAAGTFLRFSQNQATGATGPGTISGTVELNTATFAPNYVLNFATGSKLSLISSATYGANGAGNGPSLSGNTAFDLNGLGLTMQVAIAGTASTDLTLNGSGTFSLGSANASNVALRTSTYRDLILNGAVTVNYNTSSSFALTDTPFGTGTIRMGTGSLLNFNVPGDPSNALGNNIELVGNATIKPSAGSGRTTVLGGVISGAGRLTLSAGMQTTTFSSTNTYTGGTNITQGSTGSGTLVLSSANGLGGGSGGTGGVLDITVSNTGNYTLTMGGNQSVAGLNSTLTSSGNAILQGNSTINTRALTVNNTSGGTGDGSNFTGVIGSAATGGNNVSFTKEGTGTQTLSGSNTYTGATNITTGTLLVNGSLSSSSAVVVGESGKLGGSGSVGTISGSGLVLPGNSPGIMTATQVDTSGGLDFGFEFTLLDPIYSNATASGNDVFRLTSATPFTLALTADNVITSDFSGATLALGQIYRGGFFTTTDRTTDFTLATFNYTGTQGFQVVFNGMVAQPGAAFSSGTADGFVMQFEIIPEPSALLLSTLGLSWLAMFRRRRR